MGWADPYAFHKVLCCLLVGAFCLVYYRDFMPSVRVILSEFPNEPCLTKKYDYVTS